MLSNKGLLYMNVIYMNVCKAIGSRSRVHRPEPPARPPAARGTEALGAAGEQKRKEQNKKEETIFSGPGGAGNPAPRGRKSGPPAEPGLGAYPLFVPSPFFPVFQFFSTVF